MISAAIGYGVDGGVRLREARGDRAAAGVRRRGDRHCVLETDGVGLVVAGQVQWRAVNVAQTRLAAGRRVFGGEDLDGICAVGQRAAVGGVVQRENDLPLVVRDVRGGIDVVEPVGIGHLGNLAQAVIDVRDHVGEEVAAVIIDLVVGRVIDAIGVGRRIVGQHRFVEGQHEVLGVDAGGARLGRVEQVDTVAVGQGDDVRAGCVRPLRQLTVIDVGYQVSIGIRQIIFLIAQQRQVGIGGDHAARRGHGDGGVVLGRPLQAGVIARKDLGPAGHSLGITGSCRLFALGRNSHCLRLDPLLVVGGGWTHCHCNGNVRGLPLEDELENKRVDQAVRSCR